MTEQRKQLILNEIAFWKKNKLLPEQYCDFLTTLYVQGEVEESSEQRAQESILHKKEKRVFFLLLIFAGIITTFLLAAIFLTSYVPVLLVITILAILGFLFLAIKQKSSPITPLLVMSALLLLAISFKGWEVYFPDNSIALLIILLANCLTWLAAGYGLKLIYFTISGFLGVLVIFIYYIAMYL